MGHVKVFVFRFSKHPSSSQFLACLTFQHNFTWNLLSRKFLRFGQMWHKTVNPDFIDDWRSKIMSRSSSYLCTYKSVKMVSECMHSLSLSLLLSPCLRDRRWFTKKMVLRHTRVHVWICIGWIVPQRNWKTTHENNKNDWKHR